MEAEEKIDPDLKKVLTKAGAEDYIPIFAAKGVALKQASFMNDKQLSEVSKRLEKGSLLCHHRLDKTFGEIYLYYLTIQKQHT